jgi:hypothetical protein
MGEMEGSRGAEVAKSAVKISRNFQGSGSEPHRITVFFHDNLRKGPALRGIKVILASLAVVALMGFFVPALAQEGSSDEPPAVQPNTLNKDSDVLGTAEDDGVLPFTGAQMTLFVVVGFAAIGLGATALRVAKTRRSEAQQA